MERQSAPKEGYRSALVATRVTPEMKDRVERAAGAESRTVSDWLRLVVEATLVRRERKR